MRRILVLLLLCLPMLFLPSCGEIPEPLTEPVHSETETTEEILYACVDWMIFIQYDGRSYTRDFSEPTVIPDDRIGEQLGTVQSNPPSQVPVDFEESDFLSFGYRIGAPFYAIRDVNPAYEIAVYDSPSDTYHRLQYSKYLPINTQIVRDGLLAEYNYPAVRLFETYKAFPNDHREAFGDYDEAFFRDHVLAVVYLEEGSGSISHEVTSVRRVGETIEIHIRREIPEEGTCDMAYWAIAVAISREDWDGAQIVPCVSGYDEFPATAKNNAEPFYIDHPAYAYICYRGRIYTIVEHTNAPIAERLLGTQLGTVEHEIPARITAGYEAPDRSAKGFDVGIPIYEIAGMDSEYFIAAPVYDGGDYWLLFRYDAVIHAENKTLYNTSIRATAEQHGKLLTVESRVALDALFEECTVPDAFSGMDHAFFEEKVLVLIPMMSCIESTQFHIPAVYRMGDTVMICVQRDVAIPTQGVTERKRDVLLYAVLDRSDMEGRELCLWNTVFAE